MKSDYWFRMAAEGEVKTRQPSGLTNFVKYRVRLDVRSNFFSVRTVDSWRETPDDEMKMAQFIGHHQRNRPWRSRTIKAPAGEESGHQWPINGLFKGCRCPADVHTNIPKKV